PVAKKIKVAGSSSGLQALNSIPFSLSEFQSMLGEKERKLLTLECETIGTSYWHRLKDEIRKSYFLQLKRFLYDTGVKGPDDSTKSLKVYPSPKNFYLWSNLTPLGHVKVLIIGQAHSGSGSRCTRSSRRTRHIGLCFSVPPGVAIPPSSRNVMRALLIYAETKAEYPEFEPPKHGRAAPA
ncbi:hypothetical protein B0H21DRAFT_703589, partial [Amylocystis lapponica]